MPHHRVRGAEHHVITHRESHLSAADLADAQSLASASGVALAQEGAVRAPEVFELERLAEVQDRVFSGDGRVVDADRAVLSATDRDGADERQLERSRVLARENY